MGGCISGGRGLYIDYNEGGEAEFHKRFLEDRVLGAGEFGQVKLVHDLTKGEGEGEALACKVLRKGIVFKDNVLYTPLHSHVLIGECDMLRTLGGEYYCLKMIGVWETSRIIYLVTELCGGGEMMEYVSKQDQLRTEDVSRIAFQLLSAVDHCAKHGIIHRDIKPENTMFKDPTPGAELRLIDFGSGCYDRESTPEQLVLHTTFAGSAFYISPELFQHSYTYKTDIWSVGATLYVLVAGYPAENLQKTFNMLQKSKQKGRDFRKFPNMPEDMPDSYIDLLDQLCFYKHKLRKSAGDVLNHEFVQFHKVHENEGFSFDAIAAEAANVDLSEKRKLQSMRVEGSVRRHSMFLNYQQFERSLTTLLATMLKRQDLTILVEKMKLYHKSHPEHEVEEIEGVLDGDVKVNVNKSNYEKLGVIPVYELKRFLEDMQQEQCIELIDKLPGAPNYEVFAYHIALLRQFTREGGVNKSLSATGGKRRSLQRTNSGDSTNSGGSKVVRSVHGTNIFQKRSQSIAIRRANSKDKLNNSWHSGQKSGGGLKRAESVF
mmetsp:Transcript_30891/g.43856  ORF Transcript_30891/g.43856 Transcript_30891/m.43856 type:complete len:545 (+) Transcript_30891:308-1942(+)|eukprot:CAMPEP_0202462978 /NCGR_PEP_ID=MMETSP1360-20130828/56197_1 /ASSEMBLY_ACC=CAM_ASM_000848 /TAXON_ID=515479 /ORGANISM="Licmophora paradoxa, Strain CCMP2313" /LENGTH=544 /DNA_ID=CAMNT_0049085667 /DNA_START=176 /DNA_END=1813 /DNA_ORIENTATION=+